MLDTSTETETKSETTRWRPKLPARRKVTGRPGGGAGNGVAPVGGGRFGKVRRADGDDKGTYDVRNSWQVVVGSLLIPLGVVLILLAWNGAAHAKVEQQQIPYLISGGFIGLGCMIVGGLFYWGHWLYRVFDQQDLHHKEDQELMREMLRALGTTTRSSGVGGAVAGGPADWAAPAVGSADDQRFYATSSGTVYHRADCPVIADHPTDLRVLDPDTLTSLRPCQICSP